MTEKLRWRRLIFHGRKRVEHRNEKNLDNVMKLENREHIEKRTREQNTSHKWKVEHSKRITLSFFGKICKMKATTSCANVVKEIRYQVFKGNSMAISQFERENPGIVFKRSGLIMAQEYPFLGASPDGHIGDDQLIEVKCPSFAISMPPLDGLAKGKIKYLEMKGGIPQLKLSHNYMYQVQGVLHISRRKICNFVVRTPEGMISLKIQQDKDFWENKMVTELLTYFYNSLLPETIDPRHPRNMPIYECPHIKSAQEAKREKKKSETRATVETTKIICEESCVISHISQHGQQLNKLVVTQSVADRSPQVSEAMLSTAHVERCVVEERDGKHDNQGGPTDIQLD
ncbi:hypothetical protein PR048_012452 [Dryococelus australis]|uniref:YqaJ viral recombinase domain-containing protein n=1 Tax=Dryococelus australis TaxID=614101 RepID=A0ABQ9HPG3_9NEOP|nr:hypothetical protein PR048_012452 [Dryococelus australis]